jgi:hypothetical protein
MIENMLGFINALVNERQHLLLSPISAVGLPEVLINIMFMEEKKTENVQKSLLTRKRSKSFFFLFPFLSL